MAKNLILNALVDNLGTYVEDLKKEHLKLSLSTGTIELTNLQLKRTALDSLNLPIKVVRGLVQKLHLKIPWTNLGKKPVIAVLEGFLLEVRPIDLSALTASESQRLVLNYKLGIIEAAERAITAILHTNSSSSSSGGDSGGKKLSYLQQLTIKIIDNIEVKVSNVHLRFEDTLVVSGGKLPGRAIACGVTIDSLTFSTTDSAWKTTFISRGDVDHRADDSPKHGVPIIHKLAVLRNLGVYWNPIAVSSETKSFSEWVHKMITLIRDASTDSSRSAMHSMSTDNDDCDDKESTQYIVHPSNQCSLKMKHCSISSDLQPNVDLHVSSDPLMISISDEQLHQIIYVANFFADLNRRKLMISLRPKIRPTVDPRAWWQYAYKMISGVDDKFSSKQFQVMVDCRKARSTYLPFWRTNIVVGELIRVVGGSDKDVKEWQSNHANELLLSDMRSIEMKLPLSALVALRQEAARAAVSEVHRLQSDISSARAYLDKLHVPLSHSLSHSHASSIKRSTVTELNRLANSSSSSSNAHTTMMTSYKEPVHAVSSFAASSGISAGSTLVSAKNKVFGAMKVFGFSSSSTSTSSSIGRSVVGTTVAPKILRLLDDGLSNTCSVHSDQSVSKLSSSANSEEISEGGVNEEDEDEEDELLAMEQHQLGGHHTEVTSKEQLFPFRVHVDPFSMVMQLYRGEDHKPVVRSSLRISSSCQMIRSTLSVELEVSNLTIHDSVSPNPVNKILLSTIKKMTTTKTTTISSSSDDGGRPSLSGSGSMGEGNTCMSSLDSYTSGVTYNHHPAAVLTYTSNPKDKSVLQVKVMPIMVVWNQVCVQAICSMILQPKQRPTYSQIVSRKLSEQASMIEELTSSSSSPPLRKSVGIDVRIEGLSLLLPLQHDSRTTSCLVLNIEQVCVLGTTDVATGGTLSVSMDAVGVSSIHSMQRLISDIMTVESKRGVKSEFIYDDDDEGDGDGDEGADSSRREDNAVDDNVNSLSGELNYIIKPFNVSVRIDQTLHQDTRLSLNVTIASTISVLIDVTKLARVRAILDNLTTSLELQDASSPSSSSLLVHTTIDDNIKQDLSKRRHTHFTGDLDCMKRALVINLSLPPIVVTYMKSTTQFTQFSMSGIQFTVVDQFCDLSTKALKEASKLSVLALHCTGSI